jgi:hypothetical protein
MFTFKLTKISPLGEADPTYGQKYWGAAEGESLEISFVTKAQGIAPGATITAEEKSIKTTNAGKEYAFLKKVKVNGGSSSAPVRAGKPVVDPHTMYVAYSKDIVVALIAAGYKPGTEEFSMLFEAACSRVTLGANALEMVATGESVKESGGF